MNNSPQLAPKKTAITLRDVPFSKALETVTRQTESQIKRVRSMVGPAMTDEMCNSLYVLITNAVLNEGVAGVDVVAAVKTFTRLETLAAIDHSNRIPFEFAAHLKAANVGRRRTEETLARRQADERERAEAISPDDVRRNLAIVRGILGRFTSQVGKGRPDTHTEDATRGEGREEKTG